MKKVLPIFDKGGFQQSIFMSDQFQLFASYVTTPINNAKGFKMRLLILASIAIFTSVTSLFAQAADYSGVRKNGIYAEGYLIRHDFSEGFVSINYERSIGKKRKTNVRIGIYPDFESTISFPLTVSWLTRPLNHHHLEYGIGAVFRIEHYIDPYGNNPKSWFYDFPAIMIPVMYRYQKNAGLYFRAGVNLFVSWPTTLSPTLSVGYRF